MANHLDLEEQEQLDALKHFWTRWGTLITGLLVVVLGAFTAWNGYQYWQRTQAVKASALYDEVERAVAAGDVARVERSELRWSTSRERLARFPSAATLTSAVTK